MHMDHIRSIIKDDGIIFLTYGGVLSQTLISGMIEALEKEAENSDLKMGIANNIFTIFIELTQNMMNYSGKYEDNDKITSDGLIVVAKESNENQENYLIHSNNIVSKDDKENLEMKLKEVVSLDKDELKKRYRQLRREGKDKHSLGAGIGFYEIAKRCDKIEYHFDAIDENKFYFNLNITIITKD